jgi:hypothetical protein
VFIYHFNRLIRNRVLWGAFAIIIALAFVGAGSCFRQPEQGQSAGKINGKAITHGDFRLAVQAIRGFGANRDTESSAAVVDRRAWEQIAARELAAENGMATSAREVREALLEAPGFQGPNGFDEMRYRMILQQQGLTPEIYENLISQQIALMKSAAVVQSANWISPMELDDELAAMTDIFTVKTVALSNQFAAADLNLTNDDHLKFYEENKESFAQPDRVAVRYIELPASNFVESVTLTLEALQQFYDDNIESYQRTTTNDASETIPFDEVRAQIEKELKLEEALYCAETNLKFTIYGALAGSESVSLEKLAADRALTVKTSPLFSASDQLAWAQNPDEFIAAAFELDPSRPDTQYGVVAGSDTIYVIEQLEKSEAHTPKFEEVLEELKPRALAKARSEAFKEHVEKLNGELSTLMKEGKSFAEAAAARALNVSTSITYSVNSVRERQFKNSFSVAYGAMKLKKGEISDAIPVSATESLMVYVEERKPGDALAAEMMRPQVRTGINRRRATDTFAEWLTWNLKQQSFKPATPLASEEDDGESFSLMGDDEDDG